MSRHTWNNIKLSKSFYVNTYRWLLKFILGSVILNIIFFAGISYIYFHEPERDFYATNGGTPPIKLTPLATPNYSAEALLPPDPIDDKNDQTKVIPQ